MGGFMAEKVFGQCIYCKVSLTRKTKQNQTENQQSLEHVFSSALGFPKAIGIQCVCRGCNNYFNESFENDALVNSILGVAGRRVLNKNTPRDFSPTYVKMKLPYKEQFGPFQGLQVKPSVNGFVEPLSEVQIGYLVSKNKRCFLTQDDLRNTKLREPALTRLRQNVMFYGDMNKILPFNLWLKQTGIVNNLQLYLSRFTQSSHIPLSNEPLGMVEVEFMLNNEPLKRLCTKFAFNLLCYLHDPNFILRSSFDEIRNYVRNGIQPKSKIFEVGSISYSRFDIQKLKLEDGENDEKSYFTIQRDREKLDCILQFFFLPSIKVVLSSEFKESYQVKRYLFDLNAAQKEIVPLKDSAIYLPYKSSKNGEFQKITALDFVGFKVIH